MPWLTAPRYFLFGLVRVPMYEYMCGHTVAQIELMSIDRPFTAYKRTREETVSEKAKRMDDVVERWKKRKEERKKKGFDIMKFLSTGEKKEVEA